MTYPREKAESVPNRYHRWTPEDTDRLRELAAQGLSRQESAEIMGRPMGGMLQRVAHKHGMPFPKKPRRRRAAVWASAQELAKTGVWAAEAARVLGVTYASVIYISKTLGFKWGKCKGSGRKRNDAPKPVRRKVSVSENARLERIERMLALSGRRMVQPVAFEDARVTA